MAGGRWTAGVLPSQLNRVRLECPSWVRPKDITHKALGGSLAITADVRTLLQLHSAPKIQLYRRGMSRVG